MRTQETGPPKREVPAPATGTGTRHSHQADAPEGTGKHNGKPGAALELYRPRYPQWVPCTRPPAPQDINSQLDRRRRTSTRCVPLDCGCPDPWPCDCTSPPLTDKWIDAGRDAARHLLAAGQTPLLEIEILQALWRRGGDDRRLAQHIHQLTEGQIA